jgi:hypothetical protein
MYLFLSPFLQGDDKDSTGKSRIDFRVHTLF